MALPSGALPKTGRNGLIAIVLAGMGVVTRAPNVSGFMLELAKRFHQFRVVQLRLAKQRQQFASETLQLLQVFVGDRFEVHAMVLSRKPFGRGRAPPVFTAYLAPDIGFLITLYDNTPRPTFHAPRRITPRPPCHPVCSIGTRTLLSGRAGDRQTGDSEPLTHNRARCAAR